MFEFSFGYNRFTIVIYTYLISNKMKNVFFSMVLFVISIMYAEAQIPSDQQSVNDEYNYAFVYFAGATSSYSKDSIKIYYDGGRIQNFMRYKPGYIPGPHYYTMVVFKYMDSEGYGFVTYTPEGYLFRKKKAIDSK